MQASDFTPHKFLHIYYTANIYDLNYLHIADYRNWGETMICSVKGQFRKVFTKWQQCLQYVFQSSKINFDNFKNQPQNGSPLEVGKKESRWQNPP